MNMYKSILVPVDIEEDILTQNALRHVEYLAKMADADVHFLYVLPDAQAFVTAYSFGIKEFENKAVTYAEEKIRELIQGVDLPKDRMSYTIRFGTPRDEALQQADEMGADLIIVGSHRPSVKTYLLGSNAAGIVRHAKVNVMVIR